jgi:hypothetical protein
MGKKEMADGRWPLADLIGKMPTAMLVPSGLQQQAVCRNGLKAVDTVYSDPKALRSSSSCPSTSPRFE